MGSKLRSLVIAPFLVVGCQTIPDEAVEINDAEKAVDVAERRDVDDLLPSVMELAHEQLDESKALWHEADDRLDESRDDAEVLRQKSRSKARSAESLALSGVAIQERIQAWNEDPRQFVRMRDLANASEGLSQRIVLLEAQVLEGQKQQQAGTKLTGQELLKGIPVAFFETNKTELKDTAPERIQQLASFMKDNEETIITLSGFADPRGPETYNVELSKSRAQKVAEKLKDAGIEQSRIKVTGEGELGSDQVDLAGMQLQRRVDAFIEEGTAH